MRAPSPASSLLRASGSHGGRAGRPRRRDPTTLAAEAAIAATSAPAVTTRPTRLTGGSLAVDPACLQLGLRRPGGQMRPQNRFLLTTLAGAAATANALRPVKRTGPLSVPAFAWGLPTSELPLQSLGLQVGAALVAGRGGGRRGIKGGP